MTGQRPRRKPSLYVVHRWIGAPAALFVVFMAGTGLLLNHGSDWGLDRKPVRVEALLDAYGIDLPPPDRGLRVDRHWLSASAGTTYWDERPVGTTGAWIGAVHAHGRVLVVGQTAAVLLDADGALLERSTLSGWPAPIVGVRASTAGFVVTTPDGDFEADADLLTWTATVVGSPLPQATLDALPADLAARVRADARARSISWERVLLDLHSGRLPGRIGTLIADLVALALIALGFSGLGLWLRHLRRQRAQRKSAARRRAGS
ncbi:PepSY domain-containing protein [Fontimonas sp. SYSU GA230001]|uniref:PepSY domain-containing protein n=1 Tax=Fontimonas sp. SYSU GA230001 TaxID=3142450 RepID=UPI0032B51AF0